MKIDFAFNCSGFGILVTAPFFGPGGPAESLSIVPRPLFHLMDTIGEMIRTPLRQSGKLSQRVKYSQKGISGPKFMFNYYYIYTPSLLVVVIYPQTRLN
jgi:hypothetical protein